MKLRILNVVGARPNFIKIAPLMTEYQKCEDIKPILVHTGQHYDDAMSKSFFEDLNIPRPDVNLGVGAASHAVQTAEVMKRFEPIIDEFKPDIVVVVGDVNSTLACALVAAKLGVRVAHVEAGLRSFDRGMPEEINRIVTDALADYLFTTEQSANENLIREGVDPNRIFYVGNVMIDTLRQWQDRGGQSAILQRLKLYQAENVIPFGVVTLHRPQNVDSIATLGRILSAFEQLAQELPLIFPVHPRTRTSLRRMGRKVMESFHLEKAPTRGDFILVESLGYLDFLRLLGQAKVVLTDSGGIQEEATVLDVPCVTLRKTTERPVTLELGLNVLAGSDSREIVRLGMAMIRKGRQRVSPPHLWDGGASGRIVEILIRETANGRLGLRAKSPELRAKIH